MLLNPFVDIIGKYLGDVTGINFDKDLARAIHVMQNWDDQYDTIDFASSGQSLPLTSRTSNRFGSIESVRRCSPDATFLPPSLTSQALGERVSPFVSPPPPWGVQSQHRHLVICQFAAQIRPCLCGVEGNAFRTPRAKWSSCTSDLRMRHRRGQPSGLTGSTRTRSRQWTIDSGSRAGLGRKPGSKNSGHVYVGNAGKKMVYNEGTC